MDQLDQHDMTPLLYSIYRGNFALVTLLVKHGASLTDSRHPGCAYSVTYAAVRHNKTRSIEKILAAYKRYRGSKSQQSSWRYREIYNFLLTEAKKNEMPPCKPKSKR